MHREKRNASRNKLLGLEKSRKRLHKLRIQTKLATPSAVGRPEPLGDKTKINLTNFKCKSYNYEVLTNGRQINYR